ncbi:MAG TPA: BamA/TamA family outer membrane protein [Polyangiaceae bacterium]|nr:BamA/TamA family outer membrane protein [Polyangiaceae bacterium]
MGEGVGTSLRQHSWGALRRALRRRASLALFVTTLLEGTAFAQQPPKAPAASELTPQSPEADAAAAAPDTTKPQVPPPSCDPADPNCEPCKPKADEQPTTPAAPPAAPPAPCCDPALSKQCVNLSPHFLAIPVPQYNPQFDFALGVMSMVTYRPIKKDKLSPPWASILYGMYTTNDSFLLFARQEAYWDSDNNRAELSFGGGKFNSDFYGTGDQNLEGYALPLTSAGLMLEPQYMRRVWDRLYLGGRYRLFWNEAVLSPPVDNPDAPTFVPIESNMVHSGFGAVATYDSRDNRFSPTRGFYVPLNSIFFAEAFGGASNHANMDVAINYYHSWFGKSLILASRGYFTIATADTPAHMKPGVGRGADLRGYPSGRYRDNLFMAAQVELRWYFWWKLGVATWGGIGTTAAGLDKLGEGTVLPSYGLGVRFLAFDDDRLVLRVDYGRGNEDGLFYFSVSEAF